MQQRIDARVIPAIWEADYAAFRSLISLLPASYDTWRLYQNMAQRKRGEGAVVQTVTIAQFRSHLQSRVPATLAELLRCATRLSQERRATLREKNPVRGAQTVNGDCKGVKTTRWTGRPNP
jgi:hypothetical protein